MAGTPTGEDRADDPDVVEEGVSALVALRELTARLALAGCVAADEEASELVAAATGAAADGRVPETWIRRREAGEPLAWITGRTVFCGLEVAVEPGVYVPRPQTQELARRAAHLLTATGNGVDLCTGTGAVAMAMKAAHPQAHVVATDIDRRAVGNARTNGVAASVGDLDGPLTGGWADVVTAVAPYVPTTALSLLPRDVQHYEPRSALDGGSGGLGVVRRVVAGAARLLRPGGWLVLELGADQDVALEPQLREWGFSDTETWCDEEGDLRGLVTRWSGR